MSQGNEIPTMSISEFKATCLAVLDRVKRTGQPIRITRRGEPIADVIPPGPAEQGESWVGSMMGSITFAGDVVGPTTTDDDWEVTRR